MCGCALELWPQPNYLEVRKMTEEPTNDAVAVALLAPSSFQPITAQE
jgi:hypothetical protein